jgi:hypothetical protein
VQDPGQVPGWRGPGGFPPPGDARPPGGQPYPGDQGHAGPGPAGYAAHGYAAPGAFPGQAPPPGHAYPGQYPEQAGYPAAGGFAGPGGSQPYAEYRVWQPQASPGYLETDANGEPVNGGDYAYVIRQDDPAEAQSGPPVSGTGQGAGSQAPDAAAHGGARTSTRAITSGEAATRAGSPAGGAIQPAVPAAADEASMPTAAGATTKPEVAPEVDPAFAYGPDDPAYGPPGPDWYRRRDEEQAARAGDAQPAAAASEATATRGPFEPLSPDERQKAGYAVYQPADAGPAFDEPEEGAEGLAGGTEADASDGDAIALEREMSELLDFGVSDDPEDDALGRIVHLYEAAENVGEAGVDSHFDQLLARQRQLISDFFEESGAIGPAGAGSATGPAPGAGSATPFGFDNAETLTGLRGELRNAQ